jgi:hypothetical protein
MDIDIDIGADHIDGRANDIFPGGTHRGQGIEHVCYHLVELRFEVAQTDLRLVPVERALPGEEDHPGRLHHGDVVVARGWVEFFRVDSGDLGVPARECGGAVRATHHVCACNHESRGRPTG